MLLFSVAFLLGAGHAINCAANEFQKDEVIAIGCNPVTHQQVPITLAPSDDKMITHFPIGTKDIEITLSSNEGDLDVCLFDRVHGSCVHGNYNCVAGYGCRILGSAGGGPVNYAGAQMSFSGDSTTAPVSETLTITGTTTADLYLKVMSYRKFSGTGAYNGLVTYSHGGIATNCNPETTSTCVPCMNYNCAAGQHPTCDGSTNVVCATCGAGEKWNVATQRCENVAPVCWGPGQTWSTAQKGVIKMIGGMAQAPSDGCCNVAGPDAADRTLEHFCKSTGDPHINQFNHQTNHAYINGDYAMYQGQKLFVALRHVNKGRVAGNNGFVITGDLLDNHKLEYYDRDTQSAQPNRPTPLIYIDGNPVVAGAAGDIFQTACAFFTSRNIVCACKWQDGIFNMVVNDKTVFKFDRWHDGLGWNNAFLQVDPLDKHANDIGMCTYTAPNNTPVQAGKPDVDPYPSARLDCTGGHSTDPFTLRSGISSAGAFHNDYFCMPAADMRRRRMDEDRRRLSQIVLDCRRDKPQIFTLAYSICQPCTQLGNVATETCMLDACLMAEIATSPEEAAEFSLGEAQGCSEQIVMHTAPEKRGDVCPAGTTWKKDLQVCLGTYEVKRASTCAGDKPAHKVSTYIKDCSNMCSQDASCSAYVFDVFKNECMIHYDSTCLGVVPAAVQFTIYVKNRGSHFLARGGSLNDQKPNANYGNGKGNGNTNGNGNIPGPLDDLDDDLDDVHDDVDDIKSALTSVKGLHDDLEDDVRDVHAAVAELRTVMAALTATMTNQPPPQQPNPYQPQQPNPYQPQPYNPNGNNYYNPHGTNNPYVMPVDNDDDNNDDWKTIGIVSAVMSFVLLCGAVAAVSAYFCCMKK